ncbi:Yip1 domain-containing protein [Marininema mesophilum]|uniref:Yip1 domain-containing protein n=1 Tax=Marininema mesophilum TaxID=1048340 RepID=A0A1H2W9H7_9BACL|nr:YIP1 family protein [Marininema mesophilum]SDW76934.1 Yip1 domain-containing protein [Marininema mesophilum]
MTNLQVNSKVSWSKIIVSPSSELEKIVHTKKIILPFLLITLLQVVIFFGIGYIDPGTLEKMKFGIFEPLNAGMVFGAYGLVNVPMTLLFSALFQKLIAYFVKERLSFKKLFVLNVYLWSVILLKYVFIFVSIAFLQGDFASPMTSLAFYTDLEPAKERLLTAIELFSLWHFVLIAIGIHKMFGVPRKKAFIIAMEAYFAEIAIVLLVG